VFAEIVLAVEERLDAGTAAPEMRELGAGLGACSSRVVMPATNPVEAPLLSGSGTSTQGCACPLMNQLLSS